MSQVVNNNNRVNFKQGVQGLQNYGVQNVTVTVAAAGTTGTATVVAGSKVIGISPAGNQDQFVNNVAISGTTLTVTLHAAATGINTFNVAVVNP